MQEFENTARNANNSEDDKKCPYYNDCYLQVRHGGYCYRPCSDNPHDEKKFKKNKK